MGARRGAIRGRQPNQPVHAEGPRLGEAVSPEQETAGEDQPKRSDWRRRFVLWGVGLLLLGLLIQAGVVLRHQLAEPDAAVVLEGDPQRIRYGARFAKAHPALPIYISSEPVFYQVYLDALADEQVPLERFELRTCASDTVTNFTCIATELKNRGFKHLYVITSEHHMTRALTIGRIVLGRHGIAVTPLPVVTSRASKESVTRTLRDGLRAIVWAITGITGPEKTIG